MNTVQIEGVNTPRGKTIPLLKSIAQCRCPRCRQGAMFVEKNPYNIRSTMKMNETCSVCGQAFNLEVGFYYGSGYASYAVSIAVSVFSLIVYALTIGISIHDYRFLYWLFINAVLLLLLQPVIMRLARSLWLALFVSYEADWSSKKAEIPERTNETQQNNW